MTENKAFSAIKRLLTMTLALVMVFGAVMTVMTQNSYAAFTGKVGSKYTVHWYKELHYGPGDGTGKLRASSRGNTRGASVVRNYWA